MTKHNKNVFKKIGLYILLIAFVSLISYLSYSSLISPEKEILITGGKNFTGAKVYANHKLIAIMTWDDQKKIAYDKDIRSINGDILYKLKIPKHRKYTDVFSSHNTNEQLNFIVTTKDNRVYIYRNPNIKASPQNEYSLKNFKRIKQKVKKLNCKITRK